MKTNRRGFLRQAMFTGAMCCFGVTFADMLLGNDKQNKKIIDVHHHILPHIYVSSLAKIGITSTNGNPFPQWSARQSIEAMDRNGIRTAITSISAPGIYFGDKQFAIQLARQCNEYSANLIANYPGRFGAFGVLPLPDVDASLLELSYSLDTLKLDGVILLSNIAGDYLGSPRFDDVFAELNRRKAVVFIHPTYPAEKRYPDLQIPPSFFEFVFDTTRTIASLIQHNTLERFPDIRFIVAHGGGTAPYLAKKMALTAQISGQRSDHAIAQLKKMIYDTSLSTSRYSLALMKDLAGDDNIVFGSDFGFVPEFVLTSSIYELNNCEVYDRISLEKIYQINAVKLFSRLVLKKHSSGSS